MDNVVINGRRFVPYIYQDEILRAVRKSADQINNLYKDRVSEDNVPLFISVLNGAYVYTADLLREIDFACEVSFIKVFSYKDEISTGNITEMIGLKHSIKDRDIIVLDDIIDTGCTMKAICEMLAKKSPRSIKVGSLVYKPRSCSYDLTVDFPCITMSDDSFIIGYGLDYNEKGRNLKDIYILE